METDLKLPINKGFKFLLALSCVVIVIGGLKLASDLVVPIVLAFFLSVITMPILKLLRSYGVPRFIAVLLTIVVGLGILSPIVFIGLNMVSEFQNNFEGYNKELIRKVSQFQEWLAIKFDYKMTIDAEKVISTIQSYVLNFIGGAADFLKDFKFTDLVFCPSI